MIKLTQEEFELLKEVATFEGKGDIQFMLVPKTDKRVQPLVNQELIDTRETGLSYMLALKELGLDVYNGAVEYEIVGTHHTNYEVPVEETGTGKYEIETGVPIPKVTRNYKSRPVEYPLATMEIGQSFFVPAPNLETDLAKWRQNISTKVSQAKKKLQLIDREFLTGVDHEAHGVRVWRKG